MKAIYNLFVNNGTRGAFLLGALIILLSLVLINSGLSGAGYDVGTDLNQILKSGTEEKFNFFNFPLGFPIALAGLCIVAALFFGITQLVSNPKGSLKGIIGLAVVLILFFVFYSMASPETTGKLATLHDRFGIGDTASKIISGGIKTTITLAAGAAILMVIAEIRNMFK